MKTLYKTLIGMLLAVFLLGCSSVPIRIPNTTDQPFDKTKGRKISAWAADMIVYIPFPISPNDRHTRAYEELLKEAQGGYIMDQGNYITDVIVTERWSWAPIFTFAKTEIEATVYPKMNPKPSFDTTVNLNKANTAATSVANTTIKADTVCIWRKQQQMIFGGILLNDTSPIVTYPNIVIIRESNQMSDKLGLKLGAAYLRKEPDKFEFLEFVNLNMDDEALALRFGVSVPKTETPSQSH